AIRKLRDLAASDDPQVAVKAAVALAKLACPGRLATALGVEDLVKLERQVVGGGLGRCEARGLVDEGEDDGPASRRRGDDGDVTHRPRAPAAPAHGGPASPPAGAPPPAEKAAVALNAPAPPPATPAPQGPPAAGEPLARGGPAEAPVRGVEYV